MKNQEHIERNLSARAFSYEQREIIAQLEKECAGAGCDDSGHKCA